MMGAMTIQRIENSDRGITLNKQLAWTMAVGLIGTGLYVGLTIAAMSMQLEQGKQVWLDAAAQRAQIEVRVRNLEIAKGRDDERFTSILAFMAKIDGRLERIEGTRQ